MSCNVEPEARSMNFLHSTTSEFIALSGTSEVSFVHMQEVE